MSKIDTQGMSGPTDPNYKGQKQEYKPAKVKPRRLFTPTYVKELKILINEKLDERHNKMNYKSYFDTENFIHFVGEDEPEYQPKQHDTNEWFKKLVHEVMDERDAILYPSNKKPSKVIDVEVKNENE